MRRVIQDAYNVGHPWFEVEQDKFTCARNWEAALEQREDQPHGLCTDKSFEYVNTLLGRQLVLVTDLYPEVPHDVFW